MSKPATKAQWAESYTPRVGLMRTMMVVRFPVFIAMLNLGAIPLVLLFNAAGGDNIYFQVFKTPVLLVWYLIALACLAYPMFEKEIACAVGVQDAETLGVAASPLKEKEWVRLEGKRPRADVTFFGWLLFAMPFWAGKRRAQRFCPDFDKLLFPRGKVEVNGKVSKVIFCVIEPPEEWKNGRVCEVLVSPCGKYAMPANQRAKLRQLAGKA